VDARRLGVSGDVRVSGTIRAEGRHGLPHGSARALVVLGSLDRLDGDLVTARSRIEQGLAQMGDFIPGVWAGRASLSALAVSEGELDEAERIGLEVLRFARVHADGSLTQIALCCCALLADAREEHRRAVTLIGAAAGLGEGAILTVHMPDLRIECEDILARSLKLLGESAYEGAWSEGQAMTIDELVALASTRGSD